jgi:hypothetical protein
MVDPVLHLWLKFQRSIKQVYTNYASFPSIFSRGLSIDPSYQVSVHFANRFERRRFEKSTNQKQELLVMAMFVNGSGRNVQSL